MHLVVVNANYNKLVSILHIILPPTERVPKGTIILCLSTLSPFFFLVRYGGEQACDVWAVALMGFVVLQILP